MTGLLIPLKSLTVEFNREHSLRTLMVERFRIKSFCSYENMNTFLKIYASFSSYVKRGQCKCMCIHTHTHNLVIRINYNNVCKAHRTLPFWLWYSPNKWVMVFTKYMLAETPNSVAWAAVLKLNMCISWGHMKTFHSLHWHTEFWVRFLDTPWFVPYSPHLCLLFMPDILSVIIIPFFILRVSLFD